ncbi:MAG: tyrosine--tRNA ligase [Bacteriovoracaceae bacterium]|nr:tyrosine--tRNA ligase [Bacteriovoracaceae bacterium]
MSSEHPLELIRRGTLEILLEKELVAKFELAKKEKRPLRVKMGFDPTAPDLHLGHVVGLRKLKDFQDLGHEILFLIGDFTAKIGDPTGRSKTRPPLSEEEIKKNAETYKDQVFKILDPKKTKVVFNSEWCQKLNATDMISLAAQMNVARMLEREDFKNRYTSGQSISIHEFLYPLIQGYDSVALKADIELGGQDQRFNLLVGRDLQKSVGQEPQVLILLPLIEGTDGIEKMSKSLGNSIGIKDAPKEMFGKLMSIPDALMKKYFENLTRLSSKEIGALLAGHPRDAKLRLAKEIVTDFHSSTIAEEEKSRFISEISEGQIPKERRKISLLKWIPLPPVAKLISEIDGISSGEAKRLLASGSCSIASSESAALEKIDQDFDLTKLKAGTIIKVGKRRFYEFDN